MQIRTKAVFNALLLLQILSLSFQSCGMLVKKNIGHSSPKPIAKVLKEKIQFLEANFDPEFKTIPVKSTDEEIIKIPLIVAKKSKVFESMFHGLEPSSDPVPIPYSSLVIKEVINDIRGVSLNKDSSLKELVQKFAFLSRFDFPSNVIDQSLQEMTSKLTTTYFDDIIKSKEAISELDSSIPSLQSFLATFQQKSTIPFIAIEASKDTIIYVPESVARMSDYLRTLTEEKWQIERSTAINLPDYSAPLLADIFSMIEKEGYTISIDEHIRNYSLDKLIKIVNCLDFLSFKQNIQEPFYSKIYSLSKEIPLSDPRYDLFGYLAPGVTQKIFIDRSAKKIEYLMIKKFINERCKDVPLFLKEDENIRAMTFSPNNTMCVFAVGTSDKNENTIFVCNINENGTIQFNNQPIISGHKAITSMSFSPDGKFMITGCVGDTDNLFVRKVHQNNIESNYQTLKGHFNDISDVLFHPSGNIMISASQGKEEALATKEAKSSLLLWKIENDKIQDIPIYLSAHRYGVNKLILSTDGSTMISMNTYQMDDNFIWNFDKNGKLIGSPKKLGIYNVQNISFIPNSKKIIVSGKNVWGQHLFLYDMMNYSDNRGFSNYKSISIANIPSFRFIGFNQFSVSPDGSTLFSVPTGIHFPDIPVHLFSIIDYERMLFNITIFISLKLKSILYSKDSNMVAFLSNKDSLRFATLFTKEERSQLNMLGNLNAFQALYLDRILDIQTKQPITYKPSELNEITNYEKLDLPTEAKQLLEKIDIDVLPSLKQTIKQTLEKNLESGDLMSIIRSLDNKYKDELERKTFIKVIKELGLSSVYLKHHKESPEFTAEKLKYPPGRKRFESVKQSVREDIEAGGNFGAWLARNLNRKYKNNPEYQKALKEVLSERGVSLSQMLEPTILERILDKLGLEDFKSKIE